MIPLLAGRLLGVLVAALVVTFAAAWLALGPDYRSWAVKVGGMGLLGLITFLAGDRLVEGDWELPVAALGIVFMWSALAGLAFCAVAGAMRRLFAPPAVTPSRHVHHPDDLAP